MLNRLIMKPCRFAILISIISLLPGVASAAVGMIPGNAAETGFPLVKDGVAAPIVLGKSAPAVVRIAAGDLAEDVARITGVRPAIVEGNPPGGSPAVELRLAADPRGTWESFRLSATPTTLVIDGSDPRGLAYGVYELSRRIGVSPWYWWADVPVTKRNALILSTGTGQVEAPAVRYRGIFLNDEDWGLEPWASRTFEPQTGTIGPKTYERLFELMLRLRANTLWPAMHECTKAFHLVPGNAELADRYAIVLGSSHAEPMLRNNVDEWRFPPREYNYLTHRDKVLGYWEERVSKRKTGESLFTLGMRGIHDSPIQGPKGPKERMETLERIFKDQRGLLARHLGGGSPEKVTQVFCPYKEVLSDYTAGLKVPEDVTLLWPDDNFGYIRRFPTGDERGRSGGSGVYYHISYLGNPLAWLWFDSLPPALVWSEMHKAYEQGARRIWVFNVGDLKGNEQMTEWCLDLAWHVDRYGPDSGSAFLERMAARDFGSRLAGRIADLWCRHQSLAFDRKPEHLQWHLTLTPALPSAMTVEEIRERLAAYEALAADTEALLGSLPQSARDAAFQLIAYPILCARAANQRYFHLELVRRGEPGGDIDTAKAAHRQIDALTRRYNEEIAGGKWNHIMTAGGLSSKAWPRFQPDPFDRQLKEMKPRSADAPAGDIPNQPSSPEGLEGPGFAEKHGVVSIHAGHFTGQHDDGSGGWRSVPGLGRTGSAVAVLPTTHKGEAKLSYRFHVARGGPAKVKLRLLPTYPIDGGDRLRVACAVDHGMPITLVARIHDPKSREWMMQILANASEASAQLPGELTPGWHTLHLIAVDPGVVVDKIAIDLGGLKPSYHGPKETRLTK